MELKKRFNLKHFLVLVYFVSFAAFITVGLYPAEAVNYEISANLSIPSIHLNSDVTTLSLEHHRLNTPDDIVGSYSRSSSRTLLIGHSSRVFKNLDKVAVGDEIIYDDTSFIVSDIVVKEKADVDMYELIKTADTKSIVLMTCAGQNLPNQDATHRLLITAVSE